MIALPIRKLGTLLKRSAMGNSQMMALKEVATELSQRLSRIFLKDSSGRRPFNGGNEKFQTGPNWRDLILFNEYFHTENGAGLGASHQTG